MILTFKHQFVNKILSEKKISTFRKDKANRWKPGRRIHFWDGNPRNVKRTPAPSCFGMGYLKQKIRGTIFTIEDKIVLAGTEITDVLDLEGIANMEGFSSFKKMQEWFRKNFPGEKEINGYFLIWKIEKNLYVEILKNKSN